jgi:anti-sigma factor RsiW
MDRFHPADDRLIAVYFGDEEASEGDRRTVRQHLHGCETCTWRYTELTAPLERLRRDAASEADEVFTATRLDAQCAKILDRLEGRAPASRVVPFPSASMRMGRPVIHRLAMRWVAAAAAACLLLGFMAGRMLEFGRMRTVPTAPVARTATITPVSPVLVSDRPVVSDPNEADEATINEIEAAMQTRRIPALAVLDEMTPHLRPEAVMARSMR